MESRKVGRNEGKRSSGELRRVVALILRQRAGGAYGERFSASAVTFSRSLLFESSLSFDNGGLHWRYLLGLPTRLYSTHRVCVHICSCSYIYMRMMVSACACVHIFVCNVLSRELRRRYSDASNERGIRKQGTLRDWASFVRHDGS